MAFANSPAIMDQTEANDIEPVFIDVENEARPAEEGNDLSTIKSDAISQKDTTEKVETGTVLNMPENMNKPILARKLDFPSRGMSEDKVKNELGNPSEIKAAVGKPPISQWVYDDRIVYFEFAKVLHVVAK